MRENAWVAAQCAAVVALISFGARIFRAGLDRVFYGVWGQDLALRLGLSTSFVFVFWLVVALGLLGLSSRRAAARFDQTNRDRSGPPSLLRVLAMAAAVSIVLAVTAWFALAANDEIFYSRGLPWIGPLIRLQEPGFRVASRMFPCRVEGSNIGCEPHKWLSLAYFPILLTGVFAYVRSSRVRRVSPGIFHSSIRWGAVLGTTGLVLRICLYRFDPELSSPLRAWSFGRVGWTVLNNLTGILALALFLLVPFCLYRAVCAIWRRREVLPSLVDLTRLASFGVVALTLANQYRS